MLLDQMLLDESVLDEMLLSPSKKRNVLVDPKKYEYNLQSMSRDKSKSFWNCVEKRIYCMGKLVLGKLVTGEVALGK